MKNIDKVCHKMGRNLFKIMAVMLGLVAFAGGAFAQPSLEDIALQPAVRQYERQEVVFKLVGVEIENPYDPSEVALDAVFLSPSGREVSVPAFFYVAYDSVTNSPADTKEWRVRFAPTETGTYLVGIYLSMRGGERRRLTTVSFQCTPSSKKVTFISRQGKFLVENSHDVYLPMGGNRCWSPNGTAAAYLDDMEVQARNGINCVRVWLAPWWLPIESKAGVYDAAASALLDAIIAKAESLNMRVIVCIEQHGNLQPQGADVGHWALHPYNKENGGPSARRVDFFLSRRAKELFKHRLRYLIARWGYSSSILAWELFNEVEFVYLENGEYSRNRGIIARWHREMSEFVRANDPFEHLVMTSSDVDLQKKLLNDNAVDMVTIHLYKDQLLGPRLREIVMGLRRDIDAPILVEEFGSIRDGDDGRRVTRGMFIGAIGGIGGGALPWLQDVKDPQVFYKRIAAASRFFDGVRWESEEFRPFESHVVVEVNLTHHANGAQRDSLPEPVKLLALRGKTQTLLFGFGGSEVGAAPSTQWVRFHLQDLPVGQYHVEVWNPAFGNVIRQEIMDADAAGLVVEVPECPSEIALKIELFAADQE